VRHLLIPCLVICVVVLGGVDAMAVPSATTYRVPSPDGNADLEVMVLPSDIGYGFYYGVKYEPAKDEVRFRHMAENGCNTISLSARSTEHLARLLDLGIETGLLSSAHPIIRSGMQKWEQPEGMPPPEEFGKYVDQWPERVAYSFDEPRPTKGKEDELEAALQKRTDAAHAVGVRIGTAIEGESAWRFSHTLDVNIVIAHSLCRLLKDKIEAHGGEVWAYTILESRNELLTRYYTGLWCWKMRPRVFLAWNYMDLRNSPTGGSHDAAKPTPDGPVATPALDGWREGILDYRLLLTLEDLIVKNPAYPIAKDAARWLERLENRVRTFPTETLPAGRTRRWQSIDPSIVSGTAVPPEANFELIRAQVLTYIEQLQKTE